MIQPLDPTALSAPAQKIAGPQAPLKLKEMAAKGVAPGIKPGEMLAVLLLLSRSDAETVRDAATRTLGALPEPLLNGALGGELVPTVIDHLARTYRERIDVLEKLFRLPNVAPETVEELARTATEAVAELVATNEERLLGHPRIIELLYLNKNTRMSTADRLVELAVRNGITLSGIAAFKEAAIAIADELITEATEEPTYDDLLFRETQELSDAIAAETDADADTHAEDEEGKEVLLEPFVPLYKRIAGMRVSEKVRRAMLGSKEERLLLVRDSNRVVASAAVKNPQMTESEAVAISRNRNLSDEVLRIVGSTPEWMKSYAVKRNLVENPKTPVSIATRLVLQLREADLRTLAKSKNVTGPVKDAARRHLERRKT